MLGASKIIATDKPEYRPKLAHELYAIEMTSFRDYQIRKRGRRGGRTFRA